MVSGACVSTGSVAAEDIMEVDGWMVSTVQYTIYAKIFGTKVFSKA